MFVIHDDYQKNLQKWLTLRKWGVVYKAIRKWLDFEEKSSAQQSSKRASGGGTKCIEEHEDELWVSLLGHNGRAGR